MFECIQCNYKTDRSTDLTRHNNTKKHIKNMSICNIEKSKSNINNIIDVVPNLSSNDKFFAYTPKYAKNLPLNDNLSSDVHIKKENVLKEEEKYSCECGKHFVYQSGLSRHKLKCDGMNQSQEMKEMKKMMLTMNNTILNLQKALNMQQSNSLTNSNNTILANNSNNVTDNSIKNISNQKQINVYSYVSQNYNTAEPLKKIEHEKIKDMIVYKEKTIKPYPIGEVLVFQYNQQKLNQFLGDIILEHYKKKNPNEQQIWTCDVSRLSFMIQALVNQDNKKWLHDKKGVKFISYVVEPILEGVRLMLIDYVNDLYDNKIQIKQQSKFSEQIESSNKIVFDINTKTLHKQVLTYVAPYFQLELQ